MPAKRHSFNLATIERAAEQLAQTMGERPLVGRLRYLRQMEFPSPVEKGRGTKAALGLDDLIQTLFALELMHAGMTPTRTIRLLRTDWRTVKAAIAYGWSRAHYDGKENRPFKALIIAPSVLGDLGRDDRADEPLHEVVGMLTDSELMHLRHGRNAPRRMLIIDTQAFSAALGMLDQSALGTTRQEFADEMELLCTKTIGKPN